MTKFILLLLTLSTLNAFAKDGNGDVGSVGNMDIKTIVGTGAETEYGMQTCEISIAAHGADHHTITIRALGLEYSLLAAGVDLDSSTIKSKTESSGKDNDGENSNLSIDTTLTFKNSKPVLMTVKSTQTGMGETEKDSVSCKF